jgi:hypothetical protein
MKKNKNKIQVSINEFAKLIAIILVFIIYIIYLFY